MTPKIGMLVTISGHQCRIIAVHPAGTIDVERLDGSRAYRISGLSFEPDSAPKLFTPIQPT